MLKSMTGYGVASKEAHAVKYTVEIKSLNSKFLELHLRIPRLLSAIDLEIRNEVSKALLRGKVTLTITAEYADPSILASGINRPLFEKYFRELQELAQSVEYQPVDLFQQALAMPEVISDDIEQEKINESEKNLIFETITEAILQFNSFRQTEGEVIRKDIEQRVYTILTGLSEVETQEVKRIPLIRERIANLLEEWVGKDKVDNNRFEQEMIYYIDKIDITEEKVRLRSHCDYFVKVLNSDESNGKKLGFITQEMGREINTLGSKANHADIQQVVIGMKEELEKIKEQLLNVL